MFLKENEWSYYPLASPCGSNAYVLRFRRLQEVCSTSSPFSTYFDLTKAVCEIEGTICEVGHKSMKWGHSSLHGCSATLRRYQDEATSMPVNLVLGYHTPLEVWLRIWNFNSNLCLLSSIHAIDLWDRRNSCSQILSQLELWKVISLTISKLRPSTILMLSQSRIQYPFIRISR